MLMGVKVTAASGNLGQGKIVRGDTSIAGETRKRESYFASLTSNPCLSTSVIFGLVCSLDDDILLLWAFLGDFLPDIWVNGAAGKSGLGNGIRELCMVWCLRPTLQRGIDEEGTFQGHMMCLGPRRQFHAMKASIL